MPSTPRHLAIEQLLKHALALNSHAKGRSTHLVYLYWEPVNADDIPEVRTHRVEVAELVDSVVDTAPLPIRRHRGMRIFVPSSSDPAGPDD